MFRTTVPKVLRPCLAQTTPVRAFSHTPFFLQAASTAPATPTQSVKPQETKTITTNTEAKLIPDLLPLKYEHDLYATLSIHNRPYLITEGDEVTLPFRLKHGEIGDVLNFTNITTVGSRNYTYHVESGEISPEVLSVKGVVIDKTKKPMYVKEVTKRRNRHVKHHKVKHDLTVLRISELKLKI
ncbi:unnamed protein product [Ambrosiozyma monospora]|uniref:Large ribosomal subunit protein bL21m n=1 Tax=Ambrosiozyma monospora TaxID=43982 RepID=A0A9W7DDE2_AMBMO|nr:unnamed protein product [Ambrosiozyma monospora]